MRNQGFHDYVVHERLGNVSGITSRAMFGGWGIYREGRIFGIIVGDGLYLKRIAANDDIFSTFETEAFSYSRKTGPPIKMSYWLIPEEVLEDDELFLRLILKSTT